MVKPIFKTKEEDAEETFDDDMITEDDLDDEFSDG